MTMPKLTLNYSILLIILGMAGYLLTGAQSVTALIPAFFGIVFLILALLARKENLRKHIMHVAMLLAVLAIAGSIGGLPDLLGWFGGQETERLAAVVSKSVMALLSSVYLVLGIKTFIDARRSQ